MVKRIILTFISIIFLQQQIFSSGTTARFLNINISARATGMGSAHTAVADDIYAAYWNPAGLANLKYTVFSLMHSKYNSDIKLDYIVLGIPVFKGIAASSFETINSGGTAGSGVDEPFASGDGLFSYSGMVFKNSYAQLLSNGAAAGISFKIINYRLHDKTAVAEAFDIGLQYQLFPEFKTGLSISNIGTKIKFDNGYQALPLIYRLGIGYVNDFFTIDYDIVKEQGRTSGFNFGIEYKQLKYFSFRTGISSVINSQSGLTAGMGCKYKNLNFDYSFVPSGFFGTSHNFTLIYNFQDKTEETAPKITKNNKKKNLSKPKTKSNPESEYFFSDNPAPESKNENTDDIFFIDLDNMFEDEKQETKKNSVSETEPEFKINVLEETSATPETVSDSPEIPPVKEFKPGDLLSKLKKLQDTFTINITETDPDKLYKKIKSLIDKKEFKQAYLTIDYDVNKTRILSILQVIELIDMIIDSYENVFKEIYDIIVEAYAGQDASKLSGEQILYSIAARLVISGDFETAILILKQDAYQGKILSKNSLIQLVDLFLDYYRQQGNKNF